jgi:hypothetical protein
MMISTRVLGKWQLPTYSRSLFWQWIVEVAEGMQFLHDMNVLFYCIASLTG